MSRFQLSDSAPNQQYVTISALTGGFITLSDHFFVHPATPGAKRTVPSLAFLVTHPSPPDAVVGPTSKPYKLLFDLGLRSKRERYPPVLQKHLDGRAPYRLEPGVVEQLAKGGVKPNDIDTVMLSHVHYDHHGDPEDFPQSTFVVGHGALDILEHGLAGKGSHQHFQADLFSGNKIVELPSPSGQDSQWRPLGPFPAALDFFGDGSVYVLDVPGHLPGHVNLLCRVGPDRWICLCGDAFHDKRLLTGEKDIGEWNDAEGNTFCIHFDKEGARKSIERLRELQQFEGADVQLIAAHDEAWLEQNQQACFPGKLS
ncbi:hypothetical protein MBLNU459_g7976t1 [Dothideomycetes sp. NU459]